MTENFAKGQLRALVERIEKLEEEKKALGEDVREVYAEAKAAGFDVKALRAVVGEIQHPEWFLKKYPHLFREAKEAKAA